ncbi:MAG: hypothetical protein F4Y57_05235 [Acidobacteria bacterium]|nr:hypothetical protein [Acidobacteriota bacterium]
MPRQVPELSACLRAQGSQRAAPGEGASHETHLPLARLSAYWRRRAAYSASRFRRSDLATAQAAHCAAPSNVGAWHRTQTPAARRDSYRFLAASRQDGHSAASPDGLPQDVQIPWARREL